MSLFELDPKIRQLLTLDNFLGNYTVPEFVELLSKSQELPVTDFQSLKSLDPKPYIRCFETTLQELRRLRGEIQTQKTSRHTAVATADATHSRNVLRLASHADRLADQFAQLDSRLSTVSAATRPASDQLSRIAALRNSENDTIALISAYNSFLTHGSSPELTRLRGGSVEERKQCARLLKRLLAVAARVTHNSAAKARPAIEKFAEIMENDLLADFDASYQARDLLVMKQVCDILYEYNGGSSAVQLFVNQHDFFMDTAEVQAAAAVAAADDLWPALADASAPPPPLPDAALLALEPLEATIRAETQVIADVFPDPAAVLSVFIQRVFVQRIQPKLAALLSRASAFSRVAYLRVLYASYSAAAKFVQSLRQFLGSDATLEPAARGLDQYLTELFWSYVEDGRYFAEEKQALQELIAKVLGGAEYTEGSDIVGVGVGVGVGTGETEAEPVVESGDKAEKPDIARMGSISSSPSLGTSGSATTSATTSATASASASSGRFSQLSSYMKARLERGGSLRRSADNLGWSEFKIAPVAVVLRAAVEAAARAVELEPIADPDSVYTESRGLEILNVLLQGIGRGYVDEMLQAAAAATRQDAKAAAPSLAYLQVVDTAAGILHMLAVTVRALFLPLAETVPQLQQRMATAVNGYVRRSEAGLSGVVAGTVALIVARAEFLLSRQGRRDFATAGPEAQDDTPACEAVCGFLQEVVGEVRGRKALSGQNMRGFLIAVGEGLKDLLLEHFKKFVVTSTGALTLMKDIRAYQALINEWGIPELKEEYYVFSEIGTLFTVQPELLPALIKEGYLGSMNPTVLQSYITKRSDFTTGFMEKLRYQATTLRMDSSS